jgi:hypothetical protein
MSANDVDDYVTAIEAHLRARRGQDQALSPRDFALAKGWCEAGVPLAAVLVGVDRAFDASPRVSSLAYCRRFVEELVAAGPRRLSRPSPPAESIPLPDLAQLLSALLERLSALRPGPFACFEPPLRKIEEIRDLLAVAARPNWDYLRGKLREIDDDVSAAALQALPAADAEAGRIEAARAVERHRGRLDDEALADAVARYAIQRARERLALPRVSLV